MITANIGSLMETLGNYSGAFFVEPRNSEQIKDKIIECFRINKLYHYNLTWNDVAMKYKKAFIKIK